MTAQSSEILLYEGRPEMLRSLPLDHYLEERKLHMRDLSDGYSTALWRGYVGVWELADDTLYLCGLFDFMGEPFDPSLVFGDQRLPLRADWFSGVLNLERGDRLTYVHMGWASMYSQRLRLYVERGRIIRRRRFDQTKVLRRRFALQMKDEEFVAAMGKNPLRECAPLWGFTSAGLAALGYKEPPGDMSVWPGNEPADGDEESAVDAWMRSYTERSSRPPPQPMPPR